MSISNYDEFKNICEEIAAQTQDPSIQNITNWMSDAIENPHKPTMALAGFNSNHANRYNMIQKFSGISIDDEYKDLFIDCPVCMILDYNKEPIVLNESDDILILGIPNEKLKDYRIMIVDEIYSEEQWLYLSGEIDVICMVVNAAMAMHQTEREWLNNCAKKYFSPRNFILTISDMERLNDENEINDVRDSIKSWLQRLKIDAKVIEDPQDAMTWMDDYLINHMVPGYYEKQVIGNALSSIYERSKILFSTAVIDDSTIESAIDQLVKQKSKMDAAGDYVSNVLLANTINRLKYDALDGISDFNNQIKKRITEKINSSDFDELQNLDVRINSYIVGSWNYFSKNMEEKVNKELESETLRLTKQIESDMEELISNLDDSACRTIYLALGLEIPCLVDNAPYAGHNSLDFNEINNELRKETRNMILLSLPFGFLSIPLAIGNIVGAKIIEKVKSKENLELMKTQYIDMVNKACDNVTDQVKESVQKSFDETSSRASESVFDAYLNLIIQVQNKLEELKKQQDKNIQKKQFLEEQIKENLPKVISKLAR